MTATPLQMARRHVAEGQRRIDAQSRLLADLRDRGLETTLAQDLLIEMETSQWIFRADLARLEAEAHQAEPPQPRSDQPKMPPDQP